MAYKKLPSILNDDQLLEIIKAEINKPFVHNRVKLKYLAIRNITMIQFCAYTGCRPGEMRNVKMIDLDFDNRMIYIRGSSNKLRQQGTVPMPEPLVELITQWAIFRQVFWSYSEYLFPNLTGGVIDISTLARIFRDAIKRVGIYKVNFIDKQGLKRANYNTYSLRHSFGTKIFKVTGDLRKTQACLRHKDIGSTIKYIHVNDEELRNKTVCDIFNAT
jgi:integrase